MLHLIPAFRSALTIGEMALAMILLTGAWLLIRSFQRIQHVSPGYDPRQVAIAQLQLPRSRYGTGRQTIDFYDRLLERLRHTPGVNSASAITNFFLSRLPDSSTFSIEGRPDQSHQYARAGSGANSSRQRDRLSSA